MNSILEPADLHNILQERLANCICVAYKILYGGCICCYFEDTENGNVFDITSWYADWTLYQNGSMITNSEDGEASWLEISVNKRVTRWEHQGVADLTIKFEEGWALQITPWTDNTPEERTKL